jgi:hypothetical protein
MNPMKVNLSIRDRNESECFLLSLRQAKGLKPLPEFLYISFIKYCGQIQFSTIEK